MNVQNKCNSNTRYEYSGTRSVSEPFERMREKEFENRHRLELYDYHAGYLVDIILSLTYSRIC